MDIGDFFSSLSGGGPSLPPNYYLFQGRLEDKKHPVYTVIIGEQVIVDQGSPAPTPQEIARAMPGTRLYRLYGPNSTSPQLGGSYTTADPRTMVRPRDELGLPNSNPAERMVTGRLQGAPEGLQVEPARRLDGNGGGAPEIRVPNPQQNIQIEEDVPFEMPPDTIFILPE